MKRHVHVVAALLFSLLAASAGAQPRFGPEYADGARIQGSKDASVWLVIVGDLAGERDRDFRLNIWPTIDSLFVKPGRLRVAFILLPDDTSKASQIAAEVVACAASERLFWAPHALILLEQPRWRHLPDPTEELIKLVGRRSVMTGNVRECLAKHSMRGFLQGDIARARGAGIRKAPGFILDNVVLTGVRTTDEFRAAIESALAKHPPAPKPPAASKQTPAPKKPPAPKK